MSNNDSETSTKTKYRVRDSWGWETFTTIKAAMRHAFMGHDVYLDAENAMKRGEQLSYESIRRDLENSIPVRGYVNWGGYVSITPVP